MHLADPFKWCLRHKMTLLSSPENAVSFRFDWFHSTLSNEKVFKAFFNKSMYLPLKSWKWENIEELSFNLRPNDKTGCIIHRHSKHLLMYFYWNYANTLTKATLNWSLMCTKPTVSYKNMSWNSIFQFTLFYVKKLQRRSFT